MIYKLFDENEEICIKSFDQKTWRVETTLKNFAGERERESGQGEGVRRGREGKQGERERE